MDGGHKETKLERDIPQPHQSATISEGGIPSKRPYRKVRRRNCPKENFNEEEVISNEQGILGFSTIQPIKSSVTKQTPYETTQRLHPRNRTFENRNTKEDTKVEINNRPEVAKKFSSSSKMADVPVRGTDARKKECAKDLGSKSIPRPSDWDGMVAKENAMSNKYSKVKHEVATKVLVNRHTEKNSEPPRRVDIYTTPANDRQNNSPEILHRK